MTKMAWVVLGLFAGSGVSGCGSSRGLAAGANAADAAAESDGAVASSACTMLAQARCRQRDTCTAGFYDKTTYPDVMTCEAREQLSCERSLAAPKTGNSPQRTLDCSVALHSGSCDQLLAGITPTACLPPTGMIPDGAPCAFSGQCQSGYCSLPKTAACGSCASQPKVGDSCASTGSCGAVLACDGATNTCVTPPKTGDSCDKTHPCLHNLSCVGATKSSSGTCQLQPTVAGANCDAKRKTLPDCDHGVGLYCNASPGRCVQVGFAAASGASCGTLTDGSVVACAAGASCIVPAGQSQGTCMKDAADDGVCDTVIGPSCARPAHCVVTTQGGTSGKCRLLDGSFCQ